MKKEYNVVAGILIKNNKILCAKRGKGIFESKWEFPGGKIENGETKVVALQREIMEELNCKVDKCVYFSTAEAKYDEFDIYMDAFLVSPLGPSMSINVHRELKWEGINNLLNYDWCDADRQIVSVLMKYRMSDLLDILAAK